jgi:Domain of unknown function (DUF6457)
MTEASSSAPYSALDPWLRRACDAIAEAAGMRVEALDLSRAEINSLLEVARLASHESGDRRNAPLLCFLIGKASGSAKLEQLARAVTEHVESG